ncbi:arylesterase [Spongiibacter tropicus]|uniref:arylesterase n=1 Tax=Spongiibacter tropicus TaxID=454602 RepID=UPI0003B414B9|nr:arylesterase [Spongiibacter tropicus]
MSILIRRFLVVVLFLAAAASEAATAHRVLVLGDSLSAAYGMDSQQGWVALLDQQYDDEVQLINASVSGETATGGKQRLPALLDSHRPDIVILELGGNDGLRGYPLDSIRKTLAELIKLSQQSEARVLLLGMKIPPNYGQRYSSGFAALYTSLADELNVALLPFFLEGIAGNPELMQDDQIHPNADAQPAMAAAVKQALQPLLAP